MERRHGCLYRKHEDKAGFKGTKHESWDVSLAVFALYLGKVKDGREIG